MRNVYDCVEAFGKLLDKEYHLVLGRKNKSVSLQINFDKKECFHLMGLQYLTDRPELVHDRGKIFDAIRERRITAEQIQSSDLYYRIADRVDMFPLLESMIDSNDTIFKYNRKLNAYSVIKADYILKNNAEGRNIFLFLTENGEEGRYFCRSFFPQDKMDYTKNQASWTLLYNLNCAEISVDKKATLHFSGLLHRHRTAVKSPSAFWSELLQNVVSLRFLS